MSTEITIVAPRSLEESERMSTTLAKSALLPDALRNKPSDILVALLTGAEMGLAPMQALRGIVVIKGKPTLSADLMGALVKRRTDICEYLMLSKSSATEAVYRTKRRGDPEPTTMSFTMEDAKAAGIAGDMYRKYPANMLRARCLAIICRAVYPDLCMGLYDSDSGELTDGVPTTWPAEREVNAPPVQASKSVSETKERLRVVVSATEARTEPPPKLLFGPNKGTLIASLTDEQLSGALDLAAEKRDDPALDTKARNALALNVLLLETELERRIPETALASNQPGEPMMDGGAPF